MAKKHKSYSGEPTLDMGFDEMDAVSQQETGPVTVLGMTFSNDEERRAYFREQLRAKLPELHKIEGFPIGSDDDIVNLSDPPYYTACPNPWLNDFIAEWEQEKLQLEAEGKRHPNVVVNEPYAADVSEGKANPIYMAHAYHTKVPHPAIMRYILHYTQPGDIIFDGFAGTGMTGVAAGKCAFCDDITKNGSIGVRHSILTDLSPIASFITHNFNNPCDKSTFEHEANNIIDIVEQEFENYYSTKHTDGQLGTISYVIWSEVFTCQSCGHELVYFTDMYDMNNTCSSFHCPNCGATVSKSKLDKSFETRISPSGETITCNKLVPTYIRYEYGGRKYTKSPDDYDLLLLEEIAKNPILSKIPNFKIPEGVKTNELLRNGRSNVSDLYTIRNLAIFSRLWELGANKPLFRFALTSILVKTGSLLHNVGFKDGKVNYNNLEKILAAVGKEHLVLDLSCRKKDGDYYIVTDRWQKFTEEKITPELLDKLKEYADEFLVHAVDVEGKASGIEVPLAEMLGDWGRIPITYAGGVGSFEDLKQLKEHGKGRLNVTIGSALDLFGGRMAYKEVLQYINQV